MFFRRWPLEHKVLALVLGTVGAYGLAGFAVLWILVEVGPLARGRAMPVPALIVYLVVLVALVAVTALVAWRVARRLTRPLIDLTRVAGEISLGNLDVPIRLGTHVRCWEIKGCTREDCRAYGVTSIRCWYIDGTPCEGVEPRFPQKLAQCRRCEVYLAHRGDEIVQLADAIHHMAWSLRESRERLLQAERLAAVGETVAAISHSIKNILDGLKGGIYIARRGRRLQDIEMTAQGREMVDRNLAAVSELVMNLIDFANPSEPSLEPCRPHRIVEEVLLLYQERAKEAGITLESSVSPELGAVLLDEHRLFHALVNLVTNALEALANRGSGRVEVRVESEGRWLVWTVQDNGPGIPPEVRSRLFRGLVTTKGSKGTGLGLLSVEKVAREHGGCVRLKSEPGFGTSVSLVVPLLPAPGKDLGPGA